MHSVFPQPHIFRRCLVPALFSMLLLLAGCESTTRHKMLTTLFDGVPSLPQPEELCREYVENRANHSAKQNGKNAVAKQTVHPPYAEKRCNDCHSQEKDVQGGLIVPRLELCFICHPDILENPFVHGPAAVGDCLVCHVPHSSSNPALLTEERNKVCDRCHREKRLASLMHDRLKQNGLACADCHDPHSGNSRYFLK